MYIVWLMGIVDGIVWTVALWVTFKYLYMKGKR